MTQHSPPHATLWIHREKRRVYRCIAGPDLISSWTVTRLWGSIDSGQGNRQITVHESEAAMWKAVQAISRTRTQRGYQAVKVGAHFSY